MKKNYYIFVLTFLCLLCGQMGYAQDVYGGELKEVIVNNCDPDSEWYDFCACNPGWCDSGDCNDPDSSAYPCVYEDNGDCTDSRSYAYPCDPCDVSGSFDLCLCDPASCDGETPPEPQEPPCPNTCSDGFIQNPDCSCIKKVDDDCKEFKPSKEFIGSSKLYNPGETISFEGPFYFSSLAEIPKNMAQGTIKTADLVSGYNIIQHGNYFEIPSLTYKYTRIASFADGSIGGFMGKKCPDAVPDPTAPDPTDIDFDETDYENSGDFDSHDPCDPSSSVYDLCVCDPTYCNEVDDGSTTQNQDPVCTQPCTITQRTTIGKIAGELCPCGNNPKKPWFIDNDGDGYDSGIKYIDIFFLNPGKQYKLITLGPDCDDIKGSGENVHKLNSCGDCAVEPANGKCPCKTSAADLKEIFSSLTDAKAIQLADILNKHVGKFGIDTKEKLQHFLTQAGQETGDFSKMIDEDLYYSPERLMIVWPSRFSQTDSNKYDPDDYARNEVKLGEYVYGYRNGNTQAGDGFLFRGRGSIQITGRTHYTNFSNYYKSNFDNTVNVLANPDILINNFEIAIISGLWFFKTEVIDKLRPSLDANTTVDQITKKVNRYETEEIKELRRKIFKDKVQPNAKCN